MNILVTGAAGFIGSHLCEALLRAGHGVIGLDNMNQFYDPEIKKNNLLSVEQTADKHGGKFAFYHTDIRQQEQVGQILHDNAVEVVVHLAAMAGVRPSLENPLLYVSVNEQGTLTLLEEARRCGIKKFVFGSSSSVYGNNKKVPFGETDPVDNPISPYAATKKAGELLCHVYYSVFGMSVACLRFFTVYGPRQRPDLAINKFSSLILAGKKIPIYGDGSKSRDFTYIDDIIDGVVKSVKWVTQGDAPKYEIFNLGESQTTDVNTLVNLLEKAIGKPADRQYLPDAPGDVQTTFADIAKAKKILGYDPKTKIAEGIRKYVEWVLKK
jgi:UDP-glucuronate 4-epimerase